MLAYDELVKVSKESRELKSGLSDGREMFDRLVAHFSKQGEKIFELKRFLNSSGYFECDKWKKKCEDCGKWER